MALTEERMKDIAQSPDSGLTVKALKQYLANCQDASSKNAPSITYLTETNNPFAARYGEKEDEWGQPEQKSKIKSSAVFAHQVCITDLVKHIEIQTKKYYKDTEHRDTYMFYHDALSLMTAKLCVEWMKQQKISGEDTVVYDGWIKPELGLNDHISTFGGRPPRNSPELMPLDTSLNQDIHESAKKHNLISMAIRTHGVADNCLFSMATPKEAARCYKRICNPITGVVPTLQRILQDVNKVITALHVIYNAEGVYVPGLANGRTACHCHTTAKDGKKPRGGKRVRMDYDHALATSDIHNDLLTALDKFDEGLTSSRYSLALLVDGDDESEYEA